MERTDETQAERGTKDGTGAGDHDQPYMFGRRPRAVAPWPFTERQYALLLVLRGRVADAPAAADRLQAQRLEVSHDDMPLAAPTDLPGRTHQRPAA